MGNRVYTPIFRTPGKNFTEVFLPYNEAMHDTRTSAKVWARKNSGRIFKDSFLTFTGRVLPLSADGSDERKYISVEIPVVELKPTENPDKFQMALIRGPWKDAVEKQLKEDEAAGKNIPEEQRLLVVENGGDV